MRLLGGGLAKPKLEAAAPQDLPTPYLPLLASAPRGSSALEERARILHCGEGQGLAWARRFAQQQGEQRGAIVDGQEEAAPLPLATPRYPY